MINKKFLLFFLCILVLGIFTTACGGGGKATPPNYPFIPTPNPTPTPTPSPEKYPLELSQTQFTLNVGATGNITVTLNGEDITETVTYTVDQKAIATIEKGLITGLSVGIAKVTVHANEAEADKTFTVNVIDPSLPTLELSQTQFDLAIRETENVTVTLEGKDVTEDVKYNVDQEAIATVEKGFITGLSLGQTDVTVSLEGANNAIFTVTVTDSFDEEVELNDDVLDKLYKLGKIDKDSAHKTEITEINIPDMYKSDGKRYKITSIGEKIFENCGNLTKVTIPNSVTEIKNKAFYGTSIEEITIPDSVTNLGYAVNSCNSLKKITIGDGVTEIKNGLFENLTALETVIIGKNLKSMGNAAFKGCTQMTEITIPDGVETIGDSIFSGTNIKKIEIPDSITNFGYPFSGCTKLEEITIGNGIEKLQSGQFSNLTSLKKVTIGDGLTTIGNNTFYQLTALETVIIGKNLKTIELNAFYNCTGLKSINFPNTLETIGLSAFYKCTGLESISLPNTLKSIGTSAFEQCTSLKEVEIPGCVEMNQDNNKEEGITEIGNAAFKDCTSLSKLTLGNGVKTIGNNAFDGCNYNQSPDTVNYELIIPDSVTTIGNCAFKDCCFFNKLKIGTGIETIPQYAFSGCAKLEELEFKETTNIKTIEDNAFNSCAALVCTIPDQVTSIGTDAFQSVKHIYYNGSATGEPWGAKQEEI